MRSKPRGAAVRVCFWFLVPMMLVIGITAADAQGADPIDYNKVAETFFMDCNGELSLFVESGAAYQPATADQNQYCRCFGDSMADMLTDFEVRYLATYSKPTPEMESKARQAQEICSAQFAN
jgi:hypothetical protein